MDVLWFRAGQGNRRSERVSPGSRGKMMVTFDRGDDWHDRLCDRQRPYDW